MKAFVFPGQGAQYPSMGKDLYDQYQEAREWWNMANNILGFRLTDIVFEGTDEDLRQTRVTQPAIFMHSVICQRLQTLDTPDMTAGHSLGEFAALVSAGAIRIEDALRLVAIRGLAMQNACEQNPGTMAAVLGLDNETVIHVCEQFDHVVPANFNCPGQVVISGSLDAIDEACVALKNAGAKRALRLPVGGAFHSPLMLPAQEQLNEAIDRTEIRTPRCPIYQNADALPSTDVATIRMNLKRQLTSPVLWTQTVENMVEAGAQSFQEFGPGDVLKGLIKKTLPKESLIAIM